MEWRPITRVKGTEEVRPHGKDASLLEVSIRLSDTPPQEWRDCFGYPSGSSDLGGPSLQGTTISIAVEEGKERDGLAKVDERIARVNRQYEVEVLPGLLRQDQEEKRREHAEKTRLDAARERLKRGG